eukprot:CAMPEP_0174712202 /NCGR_PEP_ID=MMETSP1094-20130205/13280_1 /TAXON_ID=156173 /ORGANISM="Chrysochromulina brevifilum, Strain UTEX LB 985" /LENGTH=52 /DNA_ID=CAMNT_0015911245 /DNA_START=556 /DNA_END=714 /DNA_ORIENTATION=-
MLVGRSIQMKLNVPIPKRTSMLAPVEREVEVLLLALAVLPLKLQASKFTAPL